ncbi:ROK family protein [Clostridium ganghwense]|uniref:ROK family protein n=1 Tax=Clostridium ganghwense TaxID=312089 RepID=A0ABT4CPB0_9CLOT|nr:ROK family protein [Clostridium ganghwense]MCY6370288.1 ROK family protein [Clostridium ganghwense]
MHIGIDLGGTNIAAGLVDSEAKLICKMSTKTNCENGAESIIKDMVSLIKNLLEKNKLVIDDIELIGIGVPGLVDYENGIVKECVNLYWKNIKLREILKTELNNVFEKDININILIENDANAAAGGEYLAGSMKNHKNSFMVTLGTGVGGGLLLDGKIYRGKNGIAFEIGHMTLGENFYNCSCGNNGCFETFASATAIIKYAQKLINEGMNSRIMELVNEEVNKIDAKVVFDCAKEGDKVANLVIDRFVKYLAIGINNLLSIMDVDLISIGGGVSAAWDFFEDKLIDEINKYKLYKEIPLCKMEKATLGNDAGIIGAAMLDII